MSALYAFLVLVLALAINTIVTASFIEHIGPRFKPTNGEVWPKPQQKNSTGQYAIVRPSSLKFEVTSNDCPLLEKAILRYKRIIQGTVKNWRKQRRPQHGKLWREDENFMGYLNKLSIDVSEPCEEYPYQGMDEAYNLTIRADGDEIIAALESRSIWGALRGLETFSQLLYAVDGTPALKINLTTIKDFPRFPYRGLLVDTSRHFIPVHILYQILNAMSFNKMNVFHWHIVDDQSFPYESITFPNMSVLGAFNPQFIYTPKEVQHIIEYARIRGIRVVAEFDTPGHTRSWGEGITDLLTPCYSGDKPNGQFGPINPARNSSYSFLESFFKEIVQVFPDKYVHLGGDEVDFGCWRSNPELTEFMNANGIKSYEKLEEVFVQRLINSVTALNVSSIVWEEVFSNGVQIPKGTVVHVWKSEATLKTVVSAGIPALLSSCWYLDHLATGGDWKNFYKCEPFNQATTPAEQALVLGGAACMWSEVVDATNIISRIWPRACATAERLWSPIDTVDSNQAAYRLEEHTCRMQRRGIAAQPPNGPGFCV